MPDLRSRPAYALATSQEYGRDYLKFSAMTWNAGPAPIVIDGFRDTLRDLELAAHRSFYRDGTRTGVAPVGTFEYHRGGGHDHWHFLDLHGTNSSTPPVAASRRDAS